MPTPFIPLFSPDKIKKQARLAEAVTAPPNPAPGFAPFRAGSPVPATGVPPSPTVLPPASSCPSAGHAPPKISLEREGETIKQIRIECGCGELIELECGY